MPQLLVDFITSLDGYGAAEGWPGFWGMESPEYLTWLGEDDTGGFDVLMGATTYRLMSGFASSGEGMEVLTERRKLVFSSTLTEPLEWKHSELVTGDAVEEIRRLKKENEKDLRTIGSLALCRSPLEAGLVDRYRVVVFPVVNGVTGQSASTTAGPTSSST